MKKWNIARSTTVFLVLINGSYVCAQETQSDQFAKNFRDSKLNYSLASCEFKVAWDSIRDYGKIDDEKFGANIAYRCLDQLNAATQKLSPPLMIAVLFRNFAFAKSKFEKEGRKPFEMYEYLDYSGDPKDESNPPK